MNWTASTPQLVDGPMTGSDRALLVGYLGWQRGTLLNVCAGLTADQLAARPLGTSTLSLLGLVRHLAKVERIWLRQRVGRQDVPALFGGAGDQTDFRDVDASRASAELDALRAEWTLADAAVAAVAFTDELTVRGEVMSVRMVYVHLIGEYARHNGHADLLREALDGVTGR